MSTRRVAGLNQLGPRKSDKRILGLVPIRRKKYRKLLPKHQAKVDAFRKRHGITCKNNWNIKYLLAEVAEAKRRSRQKVTLPKIEF